MKTAYVILMVFDGIVIGFMVWNAITFANMLVWINGVVFGALVSSVVWLLSTVKRTQEKA